MKKIFPLLGLVILLALVTVFVKKQKEAENRVVRLYVWANYIDPKVLEDFTKETGIKVVEENFSSNEEVEGRLRTGIEAYDIITPSDYVIQRWITANFISRIDRDKIPHSKNLSARFQKPVYDPEGAYTIPYMFGTTGFGYNSDKVKEPITSWANFMDPDKLAPLERRVSLLDDGREVIGGAFKAGGLSLNTSSADELTTAQARVTKILPQIGRIDSNSYKDLLASGDLWLVHGYSGDILRLQGANPAIKFHIPDDGGVIWTDNLVVPTTSTRKELAYQFIDYIMRPEVNAKIAQSIYYGTTNEAAKALLPKEMLANTQIYPTDAMLAKLEWFQPIEEVAEEIDTAWTTVKANAVGVTIEEEDSGIPSEDEGEEN